MLLGVTEENTEPGSVLPLGFAAHGALERSVQDKDRATEWMLVFPEKL